VDLASDAVHLDGNNGWRGHIAPSLSSGRPDRRRRLPRLGPVVEAIGALSLLAGLALGVLDLPFGALFLLVAYGWGLLISIWALLFDEVTTRRYECLAGRASLVFWALIENLGYRQRVVAWQLRGLVRYIRGRSDWGVMSRRGFAGEAQATGVRAAG